MAIASLHSLPVFEPSMIRESQSSSSGRRGNQESGSTRTSSVLQMWRELEDECVVNRPRGRVSPRLPQESNDGGLSSYREGEGRNVREGSIESESGSLVNSESQIGPLNDQDDRQSMTSEQSQDLGDIVRERVRMILQETGSSGGNVESPRFADRIISSRAQRSERERVRVVDDWMNNQPRETRPRGREDQVAETSSQIEQVRDGEPLDHRESQPENSHRQFRKLRGRQALLDLLGKKQEERRQELQVLQEELRVVSGFAPRLRNRIQSLLRLKNMRSVESRGPSSARESELGLLRQRQTVTGLREGFQTILDNNDTVQASELSDGPSDNDSDSVREDQTRIDHSNEVVDGASQPSNLTEEFLNSSYEENGSAREVDTAPSTTTPNVDLVGSPTDHGEPTGCSAGDANSQQLDGQVETMVEHMDNSSENRPETACSAHSRDSSKGVGPRMNWSAREVDTAAAPTANVDLVGSSADQGELTGCSAGDINSRQFDGHVETMVEHDMDNSSENRPETASSAHYSHSSEGASPRMNFSEISRSESEEFSIQEERFENFHEHDTNREETIPLAELDDQVHASENENDHESNMVEDDWPEQVSEYGGSAFSNQWRNDEAETHRQQWPGDGEDLSHRGLETEGGEQIDVQEDHWQGNGSETSRNWPGTPGSRLAFDRVDTSYFSDDDNVYHIELRQLVNSGTVSRLLQSGFRESLDQLIQSYVERQTNAPNDWEYPEMLPPPYLARNREQLRTGQHESGTNNIHGDGSEHTLPTPPPLPPQGLWGQGQQQTNRTSHEIRQRPGTEWEIINDLRIDMARLQQRLNHMQKTLETCMDMQLELQRSVRQEVSAALNRSGSSSESLESILPKDSFKWDSVRKGICCVCSTTNIDSLLYRCGHMCTCTKCADVLVQGNGKCPMCQAPVIEVIRAYFIQ